MSERKMNPPIPGHKLLCEGKPDVYRIDPETDDYLPASGGCECGARPPGWTVAMPVNAVKRWHREHKAELRTPRVAHTEGEWPSRKKAT